jgi:hypothetical protein
MGGAFLRDTQIRDRRCSVQEGDQIRKSFLLHDGGTATQAEMCIATSSNNVGHDGRLWSKNLDLVRFPQPYGLLETPKHVTTKKATTTQTVSSVLA